VLDLQSVSIDGRQYALSTEDLEEKGRAGLGKNKRTAEFLGGGAAIGGIVGAFLGGAKGAAIGAGAGAGSGVAAQALTKGEIRVEAETILTFKLDSALRVVQRRRE
jgi:outer membrane lipoprotein SlyB